FLAKDPRTPWDAFQAAATAPKENPLIWAYQSIRGAAAEMAAQRLVRRLFKGYRVIDRQVKMGTREMDFELMSTDGLGIRRGLEVKGWSKDVWSDALDAYEARFLGKRLSRAQRKAVEKIDRMIDQLNAARSTTRQRPILCTTDKVLDDIQHK